MTDPIATALWLALIVAIYAAIISLVRNPEE